jgi:hypothetical protein
MGHTKIIINTSYVLVIYSLKHEGIYLLCTKAIQMKTANTKFHKQENYACQSSM